MSCELGAEFLVGSDVVGELAIRGGLCKGVTGRWVVLVERVVGSG